MATTTKKKKTTKTPTPTGSLAHAKLDGEPLAANGEYVLTAPYDLRKIPIDQITIVVEARAVDPAHVKRLAEAMQAGDVLPPIDVFTLNDGDRACDVYNGCQYILGPGRHRLEAHKLLGMDQIAAFVRPPAPIEAIERAQLLENLNRNDMLPIEEALNVARLLENTRNAEYVKKHLDAKDDPVGHVAALLGRSKDWVRDRMYIDRLHPAVRDLARMTKLPAGHLRALAKVGEPATQLDLAIEVSWSRDAAINREASIEEGGLVIEDLDRDPWHGAHRWVERHAVWLERINSGVMKIEPLSELEKMVRNTVRSLHGVPWEMSLPVIEGNVKLPACDGCPHNSATDTGLFGEVEDGKAGFCANAECYQQKHEQAEQAKKALAKLATRKKMPDADAIIGKTPGWMKPNTAKGFVQREWKNRNGDASVKTLDARQAKVKTRAHETPEGAALREFRNLEDNWHQDRSEKVAKAILADAWAAAMVLLMAETEAWRGAHNQNTAGSTIKRLRPHLEKLNWQLAADRATHFLSLLRDLDKEIRGIDYLQDVFCDMPLAIEDVLVETFGIEMPPKPQLEDFMPKPEQKQEPSKSPKPAQSKKKPTKKSKGKKAESCG